MNATGRIDIAFAPAEGAVIRMLGLVERRGFELRGVRMSEGALTIDVAPRDASRRLDVLESQLRRLVDVTSVSCSPAESLSQ